MAGEEPRRRSSQQLKAAKLQPFDQFTSAPATRHGDRAVARVSQHRRRRGERPDRAVRGLAGARGRRPGVADVRPAVRRPAARASCSRCPPTAGGPGRRGARSTPGRGRRPSNAARNRATRPSGPQLQPVLSISGTTNPQLLLLYYEARERARRQPVRRATSSAASRGRWTCARSRDQSGHRPLVAPSVQVSQYTIKANSSPATLAETAPGLPGGAPPEPDDVRRRLRRRSSATIPTWPPRPPSSTRQRLAVGDEPQLDAGDLDRQPRRAVPARRTAGTPNINGDWTAYTPLVKPANGSLRPTAVTSRRGTPTRTSPRSPGSSPARRRRSSR